MVCFDWSTEDNRELCNCVRTEINNHNIPPRFEKKSGLTSVSEILVFIFRRKKDIVLGGFGLLLAEALVLDLGKLDHCEGESGLDRV